MANLKAIKRRISAVGNTKKLTRAMKMIAAARLKRAQTKALEARLYNTELNRLLNELIKKGAKVDHPFFTGTNEQGKSDIVVFSSDRGMCGAFNEGLLKKTASHCAEKENFSFVVFGKKGRDYLKKSKFDIQKEFVGLSSEKIDAALSDVLKYLEERYLNGITGSVVVVYNRFKLSGGQDVSFMPLLPLKPPMVSAEYAIDYIYEPQREKVVEWLIGEIIRSNIYQAYLESSASELAARMVAMDAATRNAEELIGSLTMKFNRERQANITRELIDIVGGAEALK